MYATVRQLTIKKPFQDENRRRIQDELLPNIKSIPGFVDFYLIYTDKETEVSVGLFKDKKGAEQMNEMAGQYVKSVAPNVTLTTITQGEVVIQSRTPAIA